MKEPTTKYMPYLDAAKYLSVPINTLYSMVKNKEIPHNRLSMRRVMFNRDDLDAWMEKNRVAVGKEPDATTKDTGNVS